MPVALDDIAAFLADFFGVERYPGEPPLLLRLSDEKVARLGLVLEPWPEMIGWCQLEQIDALFLHRPWKVDAKALPEKLGLLCCHLPFDQQMSVGFNPRLATALGLQNLETFGLREGRASGMIGQIAAMPFEHYGNRAAEVFGGLELKRAGDQAAIEKVAVVGAMNDALVREAAQHGAEIYLTGQWRPPAAVAVDETGIAVLCTGHARAERWALRALAGVLRERWSTLTVVLPSHPG